MDLTHVHFRGLPAVPRYIRSNRRAVASWRPADPRLAPPLPVVTGVPAAVLTRAGLRPEAYKAGPLTRRMAACLRALRAPSEAAAQERLDARPDLSAVALSALLIGVSAFFRDAAVFDSLRRLVVPALRRTRGPLRVWSAACANGAELYSIAFLLAEAGVLDRAFLLGTDCRGDAVAAAREGIFSASAVGDLDPAIRSTYFERAQGGWRVVEALRRRTAWQVADATNETAAGPWDIVLCRNLAIYLQPLAAEDMFGRIAAVLSPGGVLVVGKAERPPASLHLRTLDRGIYRRADGHDD